MAGYIGTNAKRRRRKLYTYPFILIFIFLLFYFFYYDNSLDQDIKDSESNNTKIESNDNNEGENEYVNSYNIDDYELQIFEKEQQINSLNKSIQSQKKIIDELIQEKNALVKNNQNFIKEIKSLNLKKENTINDKIANLTKSLVELESEKQTILQEYKTAANQNLKFNLLVKTLEEKISESESIIQNYKQQLSEKQKIVNEQQKIIKKLEDYSHH
ncbi:MAG: hypothetical protein CFH18_00921 [Alphaproteobacteria bacterium MarineAlpha5_Bin8]|nr:MAG: hypothetical protein CFH18_00921 [Alphaproteobacteria bacterium MarineAlpha5_Bin8]PPR45448.1 MAG: hypothetical protein CFH17_00620 [Alphaproteobacteria bacterium MarineAlpha5_Bin7]|tara:strand:+ start:375 stop:1019 length:645 start_codon:yes stop_codon:yes gene_type:complete